MSTDAPNPQPAPLLAYDSPSPLARLGDTFRHRQILVARDGSALPSYCILCGNPAAGAPITLSFTWDASFTVLRTAPGSSRLQLRQKGRVHAFLCDPHRAGWASGKSIGILGTALGGLMMLAGLVIGVVSESSIYPSYTPFGITLVLVGFAMVIVALFFFTLRTRTVSCIRIESGYLYLEGAADGLLKHLPLLPPS